MICFDLESCGISWAVTQNIRMRKEQRLQFRAAWKVE